jgi:hypothetical protein
MDLIGLTWGGIVVYGDSAYTYMYDNNVTGGNNAVYSYQGTMAISGGGSINSGSVNNTSIRSYGSLVYLHTPGTLTGGVAAEQTGVIQHVGGTLAPSWLSVSNDSSFSSTNVLTINSSGTTKTAVVMNGASRINLDVTNAVTINGGANPALDMSEGSIFVNEKPTTMTSTNTSFTARLRGASKFVNVDEQCAITNTSSGVGLLLESGSSYDQQGGPAIISTATGAGALVLKGASSVSVQSGTISITAGTGTGSGLRVTQASKAAFAISPTITGGTGGGVGIFARTGYVTLENDPTAGVTGSGGAIQVAAAAVAVGALNTSFGAVIDATNGSCIARSA